MSDYRKPAANPGGPLHQAQSAVKAGLALNPAFAVSRFRAKLTASSDNPAAPPPARARFRRHVQGLKKNE